MHAGREVAGEAAAEATEDEIQTDGGRLCRKRYLATCTMLLKLPYHTLLAGSGPDCNK